jgi:chromosome segregation ATPase
VIDVEELLNELQRFKDILASATDPDTIKMAQDQIAELESKLGIVQQKKAVQDQKFDELKDYVEGLNLNETLGHPEAAKIVHKLLYDQSTKHLDELDAKNQELAVANDKITSLGHAEADLVNANDQIKQLTTDNEKLSTELEEARKDARFQLNETTRLKQQVDSLQQRLDDEKKRRSDIKPSESLQQLLEGAKAVTVQRKTPITNVQPLNEKGTHFTAQNADTGEQLQIPHYMMSQYEQVERLRMPDEDPVTEAQFPAGGQDVAQPAVVPGDAGSQASGGDDAPVQARKATLEERVEALEAWKIRVEYELNQQGIVN